MSTGPRIEPIARPAGWRTRAAYWLTRRRMGKVITPARVIYARYPSLFTWVKKIGDVQEHEIPLDGGLKLAVKYYVAWLNGCAFCRDLVESQADGQGLAAEKLQAIGQFRESPMYSERERAALEFAEQANGRNVRDEAFERLREFFDDRQIIGLAFIVATENYFNIMNLALGIGSDGLCSLSVKQ